MSFDKPNGMPTLPPAWTWKTFDQVCDRISVGHVGETNSFFCGKEGVPFLRSQNVRPGRLDVNDIKYVTKDFHAKSKKSQLTAGDILIVRVGQNRGDCAVVPAGLGELNCANIVLAKPNRKYSNYIGYFFNSFLGREALLSLSSGSAQLVLNTKAIAKVVVPVPPEDVALNIGSFLKTIDDRITLLHETNATLDAVAQALFKSWFVDFDPVCAKQNGRMPEGMDEVTAALFPDGFEESESGTVPMGWRRVPFGELLSHTIGGDWGSETPDEKNDTRVAIIRGTDIPNLQNGADGRVPIRFTSEKKLSSRKLQDGDIVLEVSGGSKDQPTGRSLYLTETMLNRFDCPVEPASFCRLLRPRSGDTGILLGQHLSYIYSQGKTWEYQNQSTGIANFQTAHFLEAELVAVPPNEILAKFASIVRPMIQRKHLTQVRSLTQLRDTLLPRLIAGQLRLPCADGERLDLLTGT